MFFIYKKFFWGNYAKALGIFCAAQGQKFFAVEGIDEAEKMCKNYETPDKGVF